MKSQESKGNRLKPDGGYVSIASVTMGLLWWSLSEGLLTSWAVRVGLALFEVRIRRAAFVWTEKKRGREAPEFAPNYSAAELASLCGLPEKRVRSALRELLELGLLAEFSPTEIRFARSLSEVQLTEEQRSGFRSWLGSLTKRRRVPIPRRALVLACESSSRALVAVILGVCLRCSWLRPGEGFSLSGRVSCGWLARRFRLSSRAVEHAKAHLVGLGWIERTGNISTLGEVLAINPAWERLIALARREERAGGSDPARPEGTNSAGVSHARGTNSAGVFLTQESLPPGEIQNPRRESPGAHAPESPSPGIYVPDSKRESKNQDPSAPKLPPPRLSSIRPEDFRDVGRALELFRQAVKCGLMPHASEHSRLVWLASIERARTVPARNPAGVFLHLVKNRKWEFLSEGHFEAANRRLKEYLWAPAETPLLVPVKSVPSSPPPAPRRALSPDALLVQVVRNEMARRGLRGELFPALRAQAGFTRERYEKALAELGNSLPATANAV